MSVRASAKTGIWVIGARGGVATTLIAGTCAVVRGLAGTRGMITAVEPLDSLPLPELGQLVFGGHDVRPTTLRESAEQIHRELNTIRHDVLEAVIPDLGEIEANIRPGVLFQSGQAIVGLEGVDPACITADPAGAVERLAQDVLDFKKRHELEHVVVVNLASTEPTPPDDPRHATRAGIEELLTGGSDTPLIASSLYVLAAARAGCGYVNFTPSPGAILPGLVETLEHAGVPFIGSDGKTGETLVKSALAPMFKYRNLRVLSWQGYNLLGDRDGEVLASEENKSAKVHSKDALLHEFLGYPLHSNVEIDYVPSLDDFKTAWDFIHFRGFLDVKMSMQFTWHGCDSVLAAPLVLDLARLTALAMGRGESGILRHLAIFFKSPLGGVSHDLHEQYHRIMDYVAGVLSEQS